MNFAKYTTVFLYKKNKHIFFFFDFLFKGVRRTTFKELLENKHFWAIIWPCYSVNSVIVRLNSFRISKSVTQQMQKMVRGLKFKIFELKESYYLCRRNKAVDHFQGPHAKYLLLVSGSKTLFSCVFCMLFNDYETYCLILIQEG